jgi:hypothetical protein
MTTHATIELKKAIFWNGTRCGSCKNRRFGGKYRLHHQGDKKLEEPHGLTSQKTTFFIVTAVESTNIT